MLRFPSSSRPSACATEPPRELDPAAPLSSGEVNFLWWFIQGSIMDADVRQRLRAGWGLCDRHTAAWLQVEAAFRHRYLHGPAVLYSELMQQARSAFEPGAARAGHALAQRLLARRLRPHGPCHLCELGLGPAASGYIPEHRLRTGRDASSLRAFMQETRAHWLPTVCGLCAGSGAAARCRAHLCAELAAAAVDLGPQRTMVLALETHARHYDESFRWERRGTDTAQDRAALISAAGWRGLLTAFGGPAFESAHRS